MSFLEFGLIYHETYVLFRRNLAIFQCCNRFPRASAHDYPCIVCSTNSQHRSWRAEIHHPNHMIRYIRYSSHSSDYFCIILCETDKIYIMIDLILLTFALYTFPAFPVELSCRVKIHMKTNCMMYEYTNKNCVLAVFCDLATVCVIPPPVVPEESGRITYFKLLN